MSRHKNRRHIGVRRAVEWMVLNRNGTVHSLMVPHVKESQDKPVLFRCWMNKMVQMSVGSRRIKSVFL